MVDLGVFGGSTVVEEIDELREREEERFCREREEGFFDFFFLFKVLIL